MKTMMRISLLLVLLLSSGMACRNLLPAMNDVSGEEPQGIEISDVTPDADGELSDLPDEVIESGSELLLADKVYWQQDEDRVLIAFELLNPGGLNIQEIELTYTLFDAEDGVIKSWMNIRQINSGLDSLGLVEIAFIDGPLKQVNGVGLEWVYLISEDDQVIMNAFIPEKVKFWQNEYAAIVSGTVYNLAPNLFQYVDVNVLLFDQDGKISGAGVTDIPFIHANDEMAFMAFVDIDGPVDMIKTFPYEAYQTVLHDESQSAENEFVITNANFYLGEGDRVYGGFEVTSYYNDVLTNTIYLVTLFDADGFVTATGVGIIEVFLPGDDIGLNPFIYLPADKMNPDSFKIDFLPGHAVAEYVFSDNPFSVISSELIREDGWVRVTFQNNHTGGIRNSGIFVLVYDQDETIIGGAQYWEADQIPAGGIYEKEIWINYCESRQIDSVRAWVAPITMTIAE